MCRVAPKREDGRIKMDCAAFLFSTYRQIAFFNLTLQLWKGTGSVLWFAAFANLPKAALEVNAASHDRDLWDTFVSRESNRAAIGPFTFYRINPNTMSLAEDPGSEADEIQFHLDLAQGGEIGFDAAAAHETLRRVLDRGGGPFHSELDALLADG